MISSDVQALLHEEPSSRIGVQKRKKRDGSGRGICYQGLRPWNIGTRWAEALWRINREFSSWVIRQADTAKLLHCRILEIFFDDTQLEVTGKKSEGVALNWEGKTALSCQTIWVGASPAARDRQR
jgi:hypothetical protein